MPLPLVALVPAVVAVLQQVAAYVGRTGLMKLLASTGAAAGAGALGGEYVSALVTGDAGALQKQLLKAAAVVVEYETGLQLDDDDPFGGGSMGSAVTQKSGVPVRNLYDKEGVREDLEHFALDQFSLKTGYQLSSLRDPERIKADVVAIGISIMEEKVHFPLTQIMSEEDPKQAMIEYFTPLVIDRITKEVESRDINAESLIVQIQAKTGAKFTKRQINKALNSKLIQQSLQYIAKKRQKGADTRRRLQNRAAQARFRAKHGNRAKYVRLSEGPVKPVAAPNPAPNPAPSGGQGGNP